MTRRQKTLTHLLTTYVHVAVKLAPDPWSQSVCFSRLYEKKLDYGQGSRETGKLRLSSAAHGRLPSILNTNMRIGRSQ